MSSYLNYKIQEFVIESLDGTKSINAVGCIASAKYYEDLFSPSIFISMVLVNTDGLLSALPIRGGERVRLKIDQEATGKSISINETKNPYYIYKVYGTTTESTRETILVELAPSELFTNETTRVFRRYPDKEGSVEKISDSVRKILKDVLKTTKNIDVEPSMNSYSFFGNSKKPFGVLTWLCPKAIPQAGSSSGESGTAGFLFYENNKGYNFKSVDSLMNGLQINSGNVKSYEKYFYTANAPDPASTEENYRVVVTPTFEKNVNIFENLRIGMYSSVNYFYDINTRIPTVYKYKLTESYDIMKHTSKSTERPKILNGLENSPSRLMVKMIDNYTMDTLSPSGTSKDLKEKYQSQSVARYNLAFSQTLSITVPLNLNLTVGDVIELNIGEVTKQEKQKDAKKSGLYLIKELAHSFETNQGYTGLKLIRDSYGTQQK
jgi:hypothetical protein